LYKFEHEFGWVPLMLMLFGFFATCAFSVIRVFLERLFTKLIKNNER
jgi:hypothetical protein